jgi:hypothetical protein
MEDKQSVKQGPPETVLSIGVALSNIVEVYNPAVECASAIGLNLRSESMLGQVPIIAVQIAEVV